MAIQIYEMRRKIFTERENEIIENKKIGYPIIKVRSSNHTIISELNPGCDPRHYYQGELR